jgi:hypothetical protein
VRVLDDDEPGIPDDDDNPEKEKRPIPGGQLAGRIELFLVLLTTVDTVATLLTHWVS